MTNQRARAAGSRALPTLREQAWIPPRLLSCLDERLPAGVLLVQAPAGCGKTAVTLQYLLDRGIEPAWHTCAPEDADPAILLSSLVRALGGEASPAGRTTLAALTAQDVRASYRAALKPFVDDLPRSAASQVLVIDECDDLLDSPDALAVLDYAIASCEGVVLVILLSRAELPLGAQAKRLLEGRAARVMAEDLLLRRDEIAGFARAYGGDALTPEDASRLYRATGGWAIAVRLALRLRGMGQVVEGEDHASFTPEARADLFAYLAAEVLGRVDARIERFLRDTAILDVLDPAVCAHMSQEPRPAELMQSLASVGLPVTKAGWSTYRVHGLLRDFLLASMSPTDLVAAHDRAARAYTAAQDYANALSHRIAAADEEGALTLADEYGGALLHTGRGRALVALLKGAAPPRRSEHYRALYWAASAAARMFDWEWAAEALDDVERIATGQGDMATARDALAARAYMLNVWGRFELAEDAARQLIASIPEQHVAGRAAAALGHIVPGMTGSGRFLDAVRLIRARLPDLASEPRAAADAEVLGRAVAAVTLARGGDFAQAHAQLNLADALVPGCTQDVVRTFVPWTRAMVGFLGGDVDAANAAARDGETRALDVGDLQRVLECRALQAILGVLRGDLGDAEQRFRDVEELRGGVGNFWVTILTLLSRPRRSLLSGDVAGALAAAEANHALAANVGEAWFVCFSRLEIVYLRALSGDADGAAPLAALACSEARALETDLLSYGAHLLRAACDREDGDASCAEALRIAETRDYRFLMPYAMHLPSLDVRLWEALQSPQATRAAVLLERIGPPCVPALRGLRRDAPEELLIAAIPVLARLGAEGAAALRELSRARSPRVTAAAADAVAVLSAANPYRLSAREGEVLALLAQGMRTKDVADRLALTPATVSTHIQRIMAKTGTGSRAELLAVAARTVTPVK